MMEDNFKCYLSQGNCILIRIQTLCCKMMLVMIFMIIGIMCYCLSSLMHWACFTPSFPVASMWGGMLLPLGEANQLGELKQLTRVSKERLGLLVSKSFHQHTVLCFLWAGVRHSRKEVKELKNRSYRRKGIGGLCCGTKLPDASHYWLCYSGT